MLFFYSTLNPGCIMRYLAIVFPMVLLLFSAQQTVARSGQSNPDSIPFSPAVNYEVGTNPYAVFCADLNGDSALDLAVVLGTGC
jgi:hypothetical protein